jgi:hypothetical protein
MRRSPDLAWSTGTRNRTNSPAHPTRLTPPGKRGSASPAYVTSALAEEPPHDVSPYCEEKVAVWFAGCAQCAGRRSSLQSSSHGLGVRGYISGIEGLTIRAKCLRQKKIRITPWGSITCLEKSPNRIILRNRCSGGVLAIGHERRKRGSQHSELSTDCSVVVIPVGGAGTMAAPPAVRNWDQFCRWTPWSN